MTHTHGQKCGKDPPSLSKKQKVERSRGEAKTKRSGTRGTLYTHTYGLINKGLLTLGGTVPT